MRAIAKGIPVKEMPEDVSEFLYRRAFYKELGITNFDDMPVRKFQIFCILLNEIGEVNAE